ncbi:MAG: HAD family phosphatase [Prevotellaceae bacterium]|jgi:putative hydrolase of the HAD superfamily|nr:HAD family phosphatase [Prevotellaceae bacterium]
MINLTGIKNIFFDLGGVLINLDKERCLIEFQQLGIQKIEEQIGHSFKSGLFLRLEEGAITPAEFRNEIRKMSDQRVTDNEIDYAWNCFLLDISPAKLEFLLKLRKDYRVFMLSNTNQIHFERIKTRHFIDKNGHSIDDYFEKCYLSYELHLSKPGKEIFEAVIADSGVAPLESLFLDDNRQNIETAQSLGFRTCCISENENFTEMMISKSRQGYNYITQDINPVKIL